MAAIRNDDAIQELGHKCDNGRICNKEWVTNVIRATKVISGRSQN